MSEEAWGSVLVIMATALIYFGCGLVLGLIIG
jgi:hypothetical protein